MILGPLHVFLHLAELGVMPWPYPVLEVERPARATGATEALAYAVTGDEGGKDR